MAMHVCYKIQCAHGSDTSFITDLDIAAMKFALTTHIVIILITMLLQV